MTTKHTHQMVFGRKEEGCPRCAELKAGAPAVRWSGQRKAEWARQDSRAIAAHFAPGGPHQTGKCGTICTFGDW